MKSDIKYARSGDVHIAFRVFGDGPRDLVLIPGTPSHVAPFLGLDEVLVGSRQSQETNGCFLR